MTREFCGAFAAAVQDRLAAFPHSELLARILVDPRTTTITLPPLQCELMVALMTDVTEEVSRLAEHHEHDARRRAKLFEIAKGVASIAAALQELEEVSPGSAAQIRPWVNVDELAEVLTTEGSCRPISHASSSRFSLFQTWVLLFHQGCERESRLDLQHISYRLLGTLAALSLDLPIRQNGLDEKALTDRYRERARAALRGVENRAGVDSTGGFSACAEIHIDACADTVLG